MDWSAGPDRFTLTGSEGLLCFTTTRKRALPPGEPDAAGLRKAAGAGPGAVVGMRQVHGGRIVKLGQEAASSIVPDCDGLVTGRRGVALMVRTADCLPIVAWDPRRGLLGVAHAGWRGVKAGIPERLAREMGASGLRVAIGPGIGPCCYEVGPEFSAWFPGHVRAEKGKARLDLAGAAVAQMEEAGVERGGISLAPWCTACERDLCCSYRREGSAAGRMVTCAVLV